MPFVIAILLGLSAALIVVYPLLRSDGAHQAEAGSAVLLDASEREQSAQQALRDLDFDYRLGNLEGPDYAELREKYERRALSALKSRFERERAADALVDEQLTRMRAQQEKKRGPAGASANGKRTGATSVANGPAGRGPRARRRKGV